MSKILTTIVQIAGTVLAVAGAGRAQQAKVPECRDGQGNAALAVSGIPEIGGTIRLALTGESDLSFFLAMNDHIRPVSFPAAVFCLDTDCTTVYSSGAFHMPPDGQFVLELGIPDNPSLVGETFFFQGVIGSLAGHPASAHVSNVESITIRGHLPVDTVYFEDFEAGWGNWYADNGIWEIGTPSSGPGDAYSGQQCAATVLGGNYPPWSNSRLVSLSIHLPEVAPGEQLRMNYQSWFSFGTNDHVKVQVMRDGVWEDIPCAGEQWLSSPDWCQASADLTAYAGESLRIGFHIVADRYNNEGPGSYVDDIHVFRGTPFLNNPETWQQGMGFWWYTTRGIWRTGAPACGVTDTPSGDDACAGTRLDSAYTPWCDSRLVSPPISVPASLGLRIRHWFSFGTNDYGRIEVSADEGCTWTAVSGNFNLASGAWSEYFTDLSAYAGQTIYIGFQIVADRYNNEGCGWFIDQVTLQ